MVVWKMCYELISRHRTRAVSSAEQILGTWRASFITKTLLMLWLDALKSAQQNGEEQCLLWSFFNFCALAFSRSTDCFTRVMGLQPTNCFCSLVAVVILSLPWNSISGKQGNLCSCLNLLVLYLVEVFIKLVASLRVVDLWGVNKYIETRPLILDKANSFPILLPKSYGDFEVSPSPAEAQSLVHHGDAVGHDNDMSKSFGRMADEVCRVARWREGGGSGEA